MCLWRYRVGEREASVWLWRKDRFVCMCMCVKLGLVCVERLGCVSLCECGTTGLGVVFCVEDRCACPCASMCGETVVCV